MGRSAFTGAVYWPFFEIGYVDRSEVVPYTFRNLFHAPRGLPARKVATMLVSPCSRALHVRSG